MEIDSASRFLMALHTCKLSPSVAGIKQEEYKKSPIGSEKFSSLSFLVSYLQELGVSGKAIILP